MCNCVIDESLGLTPLVRNNLIVFLLVFIKHRFFNYKGRFGLINKVFVVVGFVLFSYSFLTRFYKGDSITRCLFVSIGGGDGDRGGSGGRDTAD